MQVKSVDESEGEDAGRHECVSYAERGILLERRGQDCSPDQKESEDEPLAAHETDDAPDRVEHIEDGEENHVRAVVLVAVLLHLLYAFHAQNNGVGIGHHPEFVNDECHDGQEE